MMRILFLCGLLLGTFHCVWGQNVEELMGIRLGQKKSCLYHAFGAPFKTGRLRDGTEYASFYLRSDSALILTVEYDVLDTSCIGTIKVSGKSDKPVFKSLYLGDNEEFVKHLLGKPSKKTNAYAIRGEKWVWENTNYEVETDVKNKLYSVKITDMTYYLYTIYDRKLIPKFTSLLNGMLEAENRYELAYKIHPTFQAFKDTQLIEIQYPMNFEIETDTSGIFRTIMDTQFGVPTLKAAVKGEIIERVEFDGKKPPKLRYFPNEKFPIQELVFAFYLGEFRLQTLIFR